MNRKKSVWVTTIAVAMVLFLVACIVVFVFLACGGSVAPATPSDGEFVKVPPTVEPSQPSGERPKQQPVVTPQPSNELKFDDYVKLTKKESDYADGSAVSAMDIARRGGMRVDLYDFSHGFIMYPSENVTPIFAYDFEVRLTGQDDAVINVVEKDPLTNTIQALREGKLKEYGFEYYLRSEPLTIDTTVKVSIGTGLSQYQDYFEEQPIHDPTINDRYQIVRDYITKTAFGNALYIQVYDQSLEEWHAHAYILCDRDRILDIHITDKKEDHLWSYLVEVTNDVITLVK